MHAIPEIEPRDSFNEELVSNVHPPEWVNPEPASRYNLVVIGAGTGGLVSAAAAAGLGARVALIERHLMGGDCLNFGCVPSKTLIRAARAAHDARRAEPFGVRTPGEIQVDFESVMKRVRRVRSRISHHDSVGRFSELGVDVFLGRAAFCGKDAVEVEGRTLRFRKAVIATGARPVTPPIDGLEEAGFLTNLDVFNLTSLPRRLMVVGAGPIGCELAQAFSRLGTKVTLVEMLPQLLPREDPEAAAALQHALQEDEIDLRLDTRVVKVTAKGNTRTVYLESNGRREPVEVDQLLVGAGRRPNVEGLDLEKAGVKYAGDGVKVNDRLQTSNRRIYAVGDVCLQFKFTHTADAAARFVVQNALFLGRKKIESLTVPWCTYTDPEIAHVGLNETMAREKGLEVSTIRIPFSEVDRAITDGETEGFLKVFLKKGGDRILGATVVGSHAGDILSEISLAMVSGIGLGKISGVIHPYPTRSEIIRKAADSYNRTRLTPTVKSIFRRWPAWTR